MIRLMILLAWVASPVFAQDFSALARVDAAKSQVSDLGGGLVVDLYLSQAVPYRVFTLDDPRRLVLDFREVDWRGVSREAMLNADNASDLRFGPLRPGWSRMVVDLAGPVTVSEAGMQVAQSTGLAVLRVVLDPASAADFAARAGAPVDAQWQALAQTDTTANAPAIVDGPMIVAIDPGHGGIDPGAEREGVREADVVLALAIEVADAINRTGQMRAILTRDADFFVPLDERMTIARAAGVTAFISLHADALEEGGARGASVYTMSQEGLDEASGRMAERHDRGDLLAGVDLQGNDDRIATVLMDLARLETGPAGLRLADALVVGLRGAGVPLNSRSRRRAKLGVLNAPDFASVLVELGFLSSKADRAALSNPISRAPMVAGIVSALTTWADAQAASAPLLRQ
uniref:N-acetylmuramoyl-L-alanine amidase n=1 Tax=Yoonia sp. TaxID=2212373 RepID=UPI0040487F71